MALESARDSYVDLLQIKQEKFDKQKQRDANANANASFVKESSAKPLKRRTSFRPKKRDNGTAAAAAAGGAANASATEGFGGCVDQQSSRQEQDLMLYDDLFYEPCEVEEADTDYWPVWEMMGDRDSLDRPSVEAGIGNSNCRISSIFDSERIFTVPEVYDEIMAQQQRTNILSLVFRDNDDGESDDQGQCHNIFNCLYPWNQSSGAHCNLSSNNSFQSITSLNEEEDRLYPKGVIRRSSMAVQIYLGMPASVRHSFTPSMFKLDVDQGDVKKGEEGSSKRRPGMIGNTHTQIYAMGMNAANDATPSTVVDKKRYKVHFSELKRVLRVYKYTPEEAIDVWFQREDFDYFKNEMTLLIREGEASRELAEAWLEGGEAANRSGSSISGATEEGERAGGNNRAIAPRETSRSKAWWHNYDHSRRGLERYASPGQAREIIASNKVAVQKVLCEQHRQRLLGFFCVPGARDADRISKVYHDYTAWSRDLALAAGASDADAVRTNFNDDKRRTREYYMLKQVVARGYKVHKHMPRFMLPKFITPKGFLDETESLYRIPAGLDGEGPSSATLLQSLMVGQTGEEATKEMSRLDSKDLEGPVPPALLPSLEVNEGAKSKPISNGSRGSPARVGPTKKSMAEKAKNYPFQQ